MKTNVTVPVGIDAEDVCWGVALTRASFARHPVLPVAGTDALLSPAGVRSAGRFVQRGVVPTLHFEEGYMISRLRVLAATLAAASALFVSLPVRADAPGTIVDVAVSAGSFKTLVAAVKAAGLADTLSGKGPFTVFAPTDAAFAKLPAGTVDTLLKPENKEKLKAILLYHVVAGDVKSTDLKDGESVKTVGGKSITVHIASGVVTINDATVVKADIPASNGTIHVIDTVLLPK